MLNPSCTQLFAHSFDNMETIKFSKDFYVVRCPKCGFTELLPRSKRATIFVNSNLQAQKKWAYDENVKELLQPGNPDGSPNEEFTQAYGYNPLDSVAKDYAPKIQGGKQL